MNDAQIAGHRGCGFGDSRLVRCGCLSACPAGRRKLARNRLAVSARCMARRTRVPLRRGDAVELYLRPKIGFCNCDRGVADDDEVDRVADLDLMSQRFIPIEPGRVVRVADMPGRSRAYDLLMSDGSRHAAIGIAVSRRCDLLVAVAQGKGAAANVQRAALKFLATDAVTKWMTSAMDGR